MTVDQRPGLSAGRLSRLVREAVERCALDLSGARVLTEAASGAYIVTPVIAATAGAQVVAVTADSRYGTAEQVETATLALAGRLGVADRITVTLRRSVEEFAAADVITNSGHVRPIVGELAAAIRPGAVLCLMFESWEAQAGRLDIDVDTLRRSGVQIAGTNERHPHVDVFSYLGPMAVAELADAGVPAYRSRIAVLCDNAFRDYLVDGLKSAGGEVDVAAALDGLSTASPDAVLVALQPTGGPVLSAADLDRIAQRWPDCVLVQFWGDIDRAHCPVEMWPVVAPPAGHMGVLPSRPGPDAVVRLQAGGLKVAEVLLKPPSERTAQDLEYVDAY
ncbi:MAG TPA: hypothetical protein VFH38_11930 [Jatrophihabitans sp.]|nr:hypothetical protein [Jatrophihabitans sp.]